MPSFSSWFTTATLDGSLGEQGAVDFVILGVELSFFDVKRSSLASFVS
jgi:hypothetical protein